MTNKKAWGIYVHIPYCIQKCGYCDFVSAPICGAAEEMASYAAALRAEILREVPPLRARWGDAATVYIGGGTPTALSAAILTGIIETLTSAAGIPAECTVEANPGTVDEPCFARLRAAGVSRISLGVQSFDDALLRGIGRVHTAAEAERAFHAARRAGFTNISLDLMYGLPQQTPAALKRSVAAAIALSPEHISVYGLTVEEGTPFAVAAERGCLPLPQAEDEEAMYEYIVHTLPACGYRRYEISNFARPGFESRHNLSYWKNVPYLGVGAAAHSYLDGMRWVNESDTAAYIGALAAGAPVRTPEDAARTEANAMEEYAFLALRTAEGIDEQDFFRTFGVPSDAPYGAVIEGLIVQGFLSRTEGRIHLTERGMKFGNDVFSAFLFS